MNKNFPRTLSLLRKEKKISQRLAAAGLGVSQAVLSHYENGLREPGLEFVARAADYYKVSSDFLLGRTMSREDYTISAEDLPDISNEKDNVLRGSMLAILNRKLLINSLGIIFDILGKAKNRQLINDAAMYLSISIYKLFRYMYTARRQNPDEFFSVPDTAWSETADAESRLCEMRFKNNAMNTRLSSNKSVEDVELPEITPEYLKSEYPELLQSLLSILQTTGKRLNEHL